MMKIEQLINQALDLKADKAETYQALLQVIEQTHDASLEQPLAQLLKTFMPKVPAKPKTPEQWVARACADKYETREYLRFLYSDGMRLMATDGHRLHIWKTNKYPCGYYEPRTMAAAIVDFKYLDIDRVIPTGEMKSISPALIETYHCGDGEDAPAIRYTWDGVYVNRVYLKQVIDWMPATLIQYTNPKSAVKMEYGDFLALVMPMRAPKKAA